MLKTAPIALAFGSATLLFLSGCATPLPQPMPDRDSCGAYRVQHFLRKPLTPGTERAIRNQSGAGDIRVLKPNSPMTMDYRQDRLNINISHKNRIVRMSCG